MEAVAAAPFMFPTAVLLALRVLKSHLPEAEQGAGASLGRQEQRRHQPPVEAAMETSLTTREADEMLSELASGGHLLVESGTLFYSAPGRRRSEPGYPAPG